MFGKRFRKDVATALLLLAALFAGGCGTVTVYRATPEDTRDLTPTQARKLLIKAAQTDHLCLNQPVSVTHEKINVACNKGRGGKGNERSFRFAENPTIEALLFSNGNAVAHIAGRKVYDFWWEDASSHSSARDLVRAWYVLAHAGEGDPVREAAFEQVAQNYRNAAVKPPLPEAAVKYKVQAELAVQQKRFDDAVDLYDQALGIAPWWPAGHYNRGLILGELEDHQGGIRALQKYLKLEPGAANARAVQLKIYQWESLVPRAAK